MGKLSRLVLGDPPMHAVFTNTSSPSSEAWALGSRVHGGDMFEERLEKENRTVGELYLILLGVVFAVGGIVLAVVAGPVTSREAIIAGSEGRAAAEVLSVSDRHVNGRHGRDYSYYTPTVGFLSNDVGQQAVLPESRYAYAVGESLTVRFSTVDPSIAMDVESTAPSGVLLTSVGILGSAAGLALLAWCIYSAVMNERRDRTSYGAIA
jgi:hypothetical protein